jgi:hypothetical protein
VVHGPAGAGKTLLVTEAIRELPRFLYCPDSPATHSVLRSVAAQLWQMRAPRIVASLGRAGVEGIRTKSAVNLKGAVLDALREGDFCVVLDHIKRPSYSFAAVIRELVRVCETPVVTLARSPHMEDIGFLQPLYGDRAGRIELKNFPPDAARRFALALVDRAGLHAENMEEFISRVVEHTRGNPGAIVSMLTMAHDPRYRSRERIKITPLYIDFRLTMDPGSRR